MGVPASEVRFPGHGSEEIRGELYTPDAAGAVRGGVVLVHEVFGLDAFTHSVASRLAGAGWAVLAPDLYSREGVPGPVSPDPDTVAAWSADEIRAAVAALPDRRAVSDAIDKRRQLVAEIIVVRQRDGVWNRT